MDNSSTSNGKVETETSDANTQPPASSDVYKIEIRWGKTLQKTKLYQSKKQYEKWLTKHQAWYSHVYNVTGFQLIGTQWVQHSPKP
jgi:hypothetical protein